MIIGKKKLIKIMQLSIRDCVNGMLIELSCDECGQVFRDTSYLEQHHRKTGHKRMNASQYMQHAIGMIFENAAATPQITHYWEDEWLDKIVGDKK